MLEKSPRILIIPIDNRPVCYDLALDTANILVNTQVYLPDISLLGDLTHSADIEKILGWTKHTLISKDIDIAIIALDTIAYGGLIPSRRTNASYDEIKNNVDFLVNILNSTNKKIKVYAMSSIMRISDNNCNEEEKSYWTTYGKDLFRYSYLSHKLLKSYDVEIEAELIKLAREIPFEIIEDYLDTRKRNYEINSYYINLAKKGIFDKLIFSQDDTAEFGLNVEEKELLQNLTTKEQLQNKITIKTGADEMILALLSHSLMDFYGEKPSVNPIYFDDNAKKIISRYEDTTIEESVKATIALCGANESVTKKDINLLINTPCKIQDDLCLEIFEDEKKEICPEQKIIDFISNSEQNYMIADIKKANGADNTLIEKFFQTFYNDNFYGYAAWNTTGNTLGTVIATGLIKYLAIKLGKYNSEAFKKAQFVRFLDDWGYQANVRKLLRQQNSTENVAELMQPFYEKISDYLNYKKPISYEFPWNRTFEIKIKL